MYYIPYGIQYKIAPWAQFGEFLVEFYLLLRLLAFDKMCLVAFWGLDLWLLPLEGKICVWLHGWFHFACFSNAVCGERLVKFLVAIVVAFLAGGGGAWLHLWLHFACFSSWCILVGPWLHFWLHLWLLSLVGGAWLHVRLLLWLLSLLGGAWLHLWSICGCFSCWGALGCIFGCILLALVVAVFGGRLLALLVAFVVAFLAGGRFVAFFENCDCFP